ncbi:iron-containing alcohol dehydrogenase [Leptolinea sp. HRD-7]|nr:iron-containing alcohol dehydrogenase [Leptolinea sp. HRD-7]
MPDYGALRELRKFVAPEFVFGVGARNLVGRYAVNFAINKALVVSDEGVEKAGWLDSVLHSLRDEGVQAEVFTSVHSNPRDFEVMDGADLYQKKNCQAVIAVGGGSPMDCAKGIAIVSSNMGNILNFEGVDEVANPGPPLICIPTTAGSSADVSQFAIINDIKRSVKIAIISKAVVPDAALIDPETTVTMDPYLTACTGLDALTHAIEAYVSNAQSPVTDLHAREAINLVWHNLLPAINHPDDLDVRCRMMLGSMDAGLAFSNASLGAVHAMAHSLGGFLDLPHGECNALLLEHVIDFNFDAAIERYVSIGRVMGLEVDVNDPEQSRKNLVQGIHEFRVAAGVDRTLGQIGVITSALDELSVKAFRDPCLVTNPKSTTVVDIKGIYTNAC